ncbi:MAG: CDP-glycerol glycerophosphotransferase family protein, partial [Coprococcus sp.]
KLGCHMYYIIDSNSRDMDNLIPYKKNVIKFMSLKAKLYILAAKQYVSTDTRKHIYAWRMRMSLIEHMIRKVPIIFLQHGVLGLKRVEHIYGKNESGACNLFIVSSDYEKNIVKDNFGYNDDEIAVTGLARWDVLSDKSDTIIPGSIDYNMILLMPTWRNWLEEVDDETFVNSEYFIRYSALLRSPELMSLLERRNLQICFYIHPKFRNYIKDFDTDNRRIRIVPFGEEPLNRLIMRCKMLVTDYSSVSWDVFYQHKPVVFYQFDLPQYMESQGSYMNMEKELFGDMVTEAEELIKLLDGYAYSGFKIKTEYEQKYSTYFKYVDGDNSRRIAEYLQMRI